MDPILQYLIMPERKPPVLAIVLPCYNEEAVLCWSHPKLVELLERMIAENLVDPRSYMLYVDDGSRDSTWRIISDIVAESDCAAGLKLAGNVGHQRAILAGMMTALKNADAVITIDVDLQDDIRVIPEMVRKYRMGADIVFGVRSDRKSDSFMKRFTAQSFYKLMKRLGVNTVYNHADFRLMSARVVEDLSRYGERNLYLRGIVSNMGYVHDSVEYRRLERTAGETKYPFSKMLNLAADGITSFSNRPVRMVFWLGIIFILISLVMAVFTLWRYFSNETIEGWSSLMLSLWFCSGVMLMSLGVIGEYIGKIYIEVKHRPHYSVDCIIGKPINSSKNN